MMEKIAVWLLCLLCLSGCAGDAAQQSELIVFAASSLTETLTTLAQEYRADGADCEIVFHFASSGELQRQIESGADCDLFLSAAALQMDALDAAGRLVEGSRVDLLRNRVVLAAAAGKERDLVDFERLPVLLEEEELLLAIGNGDVPVGQYTQRIFAYYDIEEAQIREYLSYAGSAREIVSQLQMQAVDYGIIYATDAAAGGLTVLDTASVEACGEVVYPAAVLRGERESAAQAFLDYLGSERAVEVFSAAGFIVEES